MKKRDKRSWKKFLCQWTMDSVILYHWDNKNLHYYYYYYKIKIPVLAGRRFLCLSFFLCNSDLIWFSLLSSCFLKSYKIWKCENHNIAIAMSSLKSNRSLHCYYQETRQDVTHKHTDRHSLLYWRIFELQHSAGAKCTLHLRAAF